MKALIWKEWREQRIFLLMAVGIVLCINIGSIIYLNIPSETVSPIAKLGNINEFNLLVGSMILPALFALILGAVPFGKEFSNNTQDFLIQRPITTAKIFWLKFFFGFFLLLFIIQLCHLFLHIPDSLIREQIYSDTIYSMKQYASRFYIAFYLLFIFIYSASFFSSFLVKKELPAILFSPFAVGIGILYISPLYFILFIILSPDQILSLFAGEQETIILLTIGILFVFFVFFSFLMWQKAICRGVKSDRVFAFVTGIIFLVYLMTHAILNITTGLELSETLKQAKASGIKMTLEEIIPPPVPDEQNAALVYEEAFALVDKLKEKYKDEWEYMPYMINKRGNSVTPETLSTEQKKILAKLLLEDADFLKLYILIEKAVELPECRFDIKYEDGFAMLLPHPQNIRQLARLMVARTYILTEEKRYKEALSSFRVGLKLGESLKDEPVLISQLVRIAIDGITTESIQPIINTYPEEILIKDYQELILEIDKKEKKLMKGLEGELVWGSTFGFEKFLKGDVKDLVSSGIFDRQVILYRLYVSYPAKPLLKQDYNFYVRSLTDYISLSRLPYYKTKDELSELDKKVETVGWQFKYPLTAMIMPALHRAQISQARDNAQLDGLKIACALKIYKKENGYYPDELTALVPGIISELPLDEFTGKNFIYKKEGKGFIVYSVGSNEKDDGGISLKEASEKNDRDNYDIVWKCKE